jgi:hypothetical protein
MASLLEPVDDLGRTIDVAPFLDRLRQQQTDPIWPVSNPAGTERLVDYRGYDQPMPAPNLPPDALSRALAPAPNTEYGSVLPIARDTTSGDLRLALPSSLREQLQGDYDLTQGPRTGTVTPEGTMSLLARVDPLARPQEGLLGSLRSPPRELPEPQAGALSVPTDNPAMVSTRIVTNKTPYDPHAASDAVINLDAMKAAPEQFAQNMSLLKDQYPAMRFGDISDPASIAQHAQDFMTGNLRFIQANMPQDVADISKTWYRGGNNFSQQLSDQYGVSPHAAAGVTAVLSPKTDYNQNASLAHRVIDIFTQQQNTPATSDMVATLQARNPDRDMSWLQGRTLGDLLADPNAPPHAAANYVRAYDETYNPQMFRLQSPTGDPTMDFVRNLDGTPTRLAWQSQVPITKALSILQDDSIPNISRQLGQEHKVRNFYNNIVDPDNTRGDLTVDTHQIAGNLLQPVGQSSPLVEQGLSGGKGMAYSGTTGAGGFYGLHGDAVRDFAQQAEMLPREAQSMTWEGLRGLFSPVQKRNKNLVSGAENIWQNVASGGISADDARNQLLDLFGGISNPPWYRPGGADRVPAGELGLGTAPGVVGGSGSGAAGAPPGLVTPGGVQGVSAGMGSADLPGGGGRPRLLLRPPGYADGGLINGPPIAAPPIAGFVPPATTPPGIDNLAAPLPQGGAVLPAPALSLLGGGNPLLGARHLDRHLTKPAKRAGAATMGRVSPGEYVVHPDQLGSLLSLLGGARP